MPYSLFLHHFTNKKETRSANITTVSYNQLEAKSKLRLKVSQDQNQGLCWTESSPGVSEKNLLSVSFNLLKEFCLLRL